MGKQTTLMQLFCFITEPCGSASIQLDPMESLYLQSPGYPSDVITSTDCEWTITSSKSTRIQITVHDLQIWPFSASFSISDMTVSNNTQYIVRNPREAKLREVVSYGHVIRVTFWQKELIGQPDQDQR